MKPLLLALPGYFYYYHQAGLLRTRFALPRLLPDYASLLEAEARPSAIEFEKVGLDTESFAAAAFFEQVFHDAKAGQGLIFHSLYSRSMHPGCLRTQGQEWNQAFTIQYAIATPDLALTTNTDSRPAATKAPQLNGQKQSRVLCLNNPLGEPPLREATAQATHIAGLLEAGGQQVHFIQRPCQAAELAQILKGVDQFYYFGHARWHAGQIQIPLHDGWYDLKALQEGHLLDGLVLAACMELQGETPDLLARWMLLPSVKLADREAVFITEFVQSLLAEGQPDVALLAACRADAQAQDVRRWNFRLYQHAPPLLH